MLPAGGVSKRPGSTTDATPVIGHASRLPDYRAGAKHMEWKHFRTIGVADDAPVSFPGLPICFRINHPQP